MIESKTMVSKTQILPIVKLSDLWKMKYNIVHELRHHLVTYVQITKSVHIVQ